MNRERLKIIFPLFVVLTVFLNLSPTFGQSLQSLMLYPFGVATQPCLLTGSSAFPCRAVVRFKYAEKIIEFSYTCNRIPGDGGKFIFKS